MKSRWTWVGGAVVVVAIAALTVVLWPGGDPLAGVEAVVLQPPDWQAAPEGELIQEPFVEGLKLTLEDRDITIVTDLEKADAVLTIKEIKLDELEVLITEGRISGRLSAVCTLTDLKTGKEYLMDFYLTLEDDTVEARLVTRKF